MCGVRRYAEGAKRTSLGVLNVIPVHVDVVVAVKARVLMDERDCVPAQDLRFSVKQLPPPDSHELVLNCARIEAAVAQR